MDPHETTFRAHIEGNASAAEQQKADDHLKECGDCREYVSFVRDLSAGIKEISEDAASLDDPHASSSTIFAYTEGTLDTESSLHLRAHMLFCDECAEKYYLLKRMRAPSWTEVVIEAVRTAKEWLLKPLEITGMGEFVPLSAEASRGDSDEPESIVEIVQMVSDSMQETQLHLYVDLNERRPGAIARVSIASDTPLKAWKAQLLDTTGNLIASVPLSEGRQVLHSGLTPGTFIAQVLKEEEVLAECRLKFRAPNQPTGV